MAPTIPAPKYLDLSPENRGFNWDLFRQTWQNYEIASALNEKPENVRIATLLSMIGNDALQVYNAFVWQQHEDHTILNILNKFEIYCRPKRNTSYERYIFLSRKQKKDENIDDFVIVLRNLSKSCNYENLTDSVIRDAIILGINNRKTQECLLRENDPSLDTCINIVKAAERAKQHAVYISNNREDGDATEPMEIDKLYHDRTNNKRKCKFCGKAHKFGREFCPAYGKDCGACGGKNHFQAVCLRKNQIKFVADEEFEIQ